jgi:hypothetical protein
MANALQQPEVDPGNRPIEHQSIAGDSSNSALSEEARRQAHLAHAEQARLRQALDLQRENILSQRTSHPARRSALEAALAQIEGQIEALAKS